MAAAGMWGWPFIQLQECSSRAPISPSEIINTKCRHAAAMSSGMYTWSSPLDPGTPELMLIRWLLESPQGWECGGLVVRGADHGIKGLELATPLPVLRSERGWRLSAIAKGQWLHHWNGISTKTLNGRGWGAAGLVNTQRCWRDTAALHPLLLVWQISFMWVFFSFSLHYKPVIAGKPFSWVLWAVLANYQYWGGGCTNLLIDSWSVRRSEGPRIAMGINLMWLSS